jgi:hypothetical protein
MIARNFAEIVMEDENVPCQCQLLREVLTGDPFGWTSDEDIPY